MEPSGDAAELVEGQAAPERLAGAFLGALEEREPQSHLEVASPILGGPTGIAWRLHEPIVMHRLTALPVGRSSPSPAVEGGPSGTEGPQPAPAESDVAGQLALWLADVSLEAKLAPAPPEPDTPRSPLTEPR